MFGLLLGPKSILGIKFGSLKGICRKRKEERLDKWENVKENIRPEKGSIAYVHVRWKIVEQPAELWTNSVHRKPGCQPLI